VPHINLQIESQGPVLNCLIGVSHARQEALKKAKKPVPKRIMIRALIDTGASCTILHSSIPPRLGLSPRGKVPIDFAQGESVEVNEYDISLVIPHSSAVTRQAFPTLPLAFNTIAVAESNSLKRVGFDALIGRDVLEGCVLIYDGLNHRCLLSY